ncbi:hypothetical protein GCM10010912_16720 [Paenibacillus albidus]|uniref:Uncharacterized protein n=1 Tax=Paenibacillus albidus TaxID=2041023 RepID=A0A917FFZ9_9BACL|nr:hypothetical protein GCM10010912_16720 [Paenibacillus albidus]
MVDDMTLPLLATIWFERSPLQHHVLIKNIMRSEHKKKHASTSDAYVPSQFAN